MRIINHSEREELLDMLEQAVQVYHVWFLYKFILAHILDIYCWDMCRTYALSQGGFFNYRNAGSHVCLWL